MAPPSASSPSSPPPELARIEGLAFAYPGGRTLFADLTLEVRGGELLGVLGPNGAGKSTLLSLLCGLARPAAGRLFLGGDPLEGLSRRELARRIALVPQDVGAAFPFTVLQTVLLGRTPHLGPLGIERAEDLERAEAVLEETGLSALRDRPIDALSGGERQRVLIARALCQDTPLLACDEPTSHLDIHHQVKTYDLFHRLTRDPARGALCVLHDLNLAAAYCDRILLLDAEGRQAALGPTEEVLSYALLKEVYRTEIWVGVNELTGALTLAPVAGHDRAPPPVGGGRVGDR
ncbi:MAG: ABC transporter ATP-binding protein [Deltaproteobacteria bacterium]|nr:ABC transporter ATP-binding protein [Deltaproteobacteria bacterium]